MRKTLLGLCVLSALASPVYAAAPPPQTQAQRIAALEAKVQALEAELEAMKSPATTAAQPAPAAAATSSDSTQSEIDALAATPSDTANAGGDTAQVAAPAGASSAGSNANAFNPAISIILNGSYSHHSLDPTAYARAGFPIVGEGGPSANGFSLGESELSLASNIDDKFYGQLTLTAESEDGQDHIGVEEAFVDTTSLPDNFSVRAGRFYSNIG